MTDEDTIPIAWHRIDVIFENDGSIVQNEVPDSLVDAVLEAVMASMEYEHFGTEKIHDTHTGLYQEEDTPEVEWDVGVGIIVKSSTTSLRQLEQIREIVKETTTLNVTHVGVASEIREMAEDEIR